jgi:hypothetical protein
MSNYALDRLLVKHGSLVITPADDGSGFNVEAVVPIQGTMTFQSTEWLGSGRYPEDALGDAVMRLNDACLSTTSKD